MKQLYSQYGLQAAGNPLDLQTKQPTSVPDPVTFTIGLPNTDLLPKKEMELAFHKFIQTKDQSLYHYCNSRGLDELVDSISRREKISKDHIIITTGNSQALDFCSRLFFDEQDTIVFEDYTYPAIFSFVKQMNMEAILVPSDSDGLDVEHLENTLLNKKIKAVYVIPNAQNPMGTTLSLKKRKRLIELAYKHDFMILEDDPYRDLMFDGLRLPTIFELDKEKRRTIYMYSFSKTIAPTLRTGFILAHPEYINTLDLFKQAVDSCTSPLNQLVVNDLYGTDKWELHLKKQQEFYKERKEIFESFLARMNQKYNWVSFAPKGGLFYWVDTQTPNVDKWQRIAQVQGLDFLPGSLFSLSDPENTKIRLCFSYCTVDEMKKGLDRLESSYAEWQKIKKETLTPY